MKTKKADDGTASTAAGGNLEKCNTGEPVETILAELTGLSNEVVAGKTHVDATFFSTRGEALKLKVACEKGDTGEVLAQLLLFRGEPSPREYIARLESAIAGEKAAADNASTDAPKTEPVPTAAPVAENMPVPVAHACKPSPEETNSALDRDPGEHDPAVKRGSRKKSGPGKLDPDDTRPHTMKMSEAMMGPRTGNDERSSPEAGRKARLTLRSAKDGKYYLPTSSLPEYTGCSDILAELGMGGVLRRREIDGHLIRMPTALLKDKKFGRVLWLDKGGTAAGSNRESTPEFCFSMLGLKELERIRKLRCGEGNGDELVS